VSGAAAADSASRDSASRDTAWGSGAPAWDRPLAAVLGARTATALEKHLGLATVGDLLWHLPRRYDERGQLTELSGLSEGDHVTVFARVETVNRRRARTGTALTEVTVTDGRAKLALVFFGPRGPHHKLTPGTTAYFAGRVGRFRNSMQLAQPEVIVTDGDEDPDLVAGAVLPIYPAAASVTTLAVARCVATVLGGLSSLPDPLPEQLRERDRLPDLLTAFRWVHQPQDLAEVARGKARLRVDEAFVTQVVLARRRADTVHTTTTARPPRADGLLTAFDATLPFALTAGQREVGQTLADELARPVPTHRLLQGEVGSGKTVVALRAMLQVVDAGGQAALLAPTEVLASQHARGLRSLLGPLGRDGELDAADVATRVALLTGSVSAAARRRVLAEIADGSAGIVVGTHALLTESVQFRDLGLVVVDEQHRFGVEQRDVLRRRGVTPPHVLVMTATPIPRTVAMTVFGDLEVSTLTELPAGRSPIRSFVVPAGQPAWIDRMWGRVRDEVAAGRQAFVVCPRIGDEDPGQSGIADDPDGGADDPRDDGPDGSDGARTTAAVVEVTQALQEGPLRGLRVAMLHGRQPTDEKDAVMQRFVAGELDVLVSTTVIEVGVDVPNATVMAVLDADRFGVSQLHQLRGRVGRGAAQGWCLLHTQASPDSPAGQRLAAVAETLDGTRLAELDLEQRREGDVLGAAQSGGRRRLRLLSVLRDADVIAQARADATALVERDPELAEHPDLRDAVSAVLDETAAAFLAKG
jgi:ATP-dependent DNA helicase RecG